MSSFLSRRWFRLGHISDETLACFLSGELSSLRALRVGSHLNRCWECRARRDELERAALLVVEFRRGNQASCLPLDPDYRRSFIAKVEANSNTPGSVRHWPRLSFPLRRYLPAMDPTFASVVIVAVAGVLLFGIWQHSSTTVSAPELLRRAESSEEQHSAQHPAGVLYQQVVVHAGRASLRHSVYRDLSGHRHMRPVSLTPAELEVRKTLEAAGVAWEEPLSAKDFRSWHDHQKEPRDEVRRTGQSELTLTTTLSRGEVSQESLTVRESDFHPIRRVVEMRDQQTIEVAELDFAVLGWSAVNQGLFEPFPTVAAGESAAALHVALPHRMPTPMEIDVAELSARAALAQLGSESGDQVSVTHTGSGVAVKGIVATNQRKRQLMARLNQISFVHPEFLSSEEMQSHSVNGGHSSAQLSSSRVELYAASDSLAPLAKFLSDRRAQPNQLSTISRQILTSSLRVQEAGSRFLDLENRFASAAGLPQSARIQLESLIGAQQKEVKDGLDAQLSALAQVGLADGNPIGEPPHPGSMDRAIFRQSLARNQQYCQDLITAPLAEPRPASAIAADIQSSIHQIRASLAEISKSSVQP